MTYENKIDLLKNVTRLEPITIGGVNKRAAHNQAISKGTKAYYQTEAGIAEKKARSERTKAYWNSPEGQAKKERLREKMRKSKD
jgi:hypothetical protein